MACSKNEKPLRSVTYSGRYSQDSISGLELVQEVQRVYVAPSAKIKGLLADTVE
jgi:hypothetical protein